MKMLPFFLNWTMGQSGSMKNSRSWETVMVIFWFLLILYSYPISIDMSTFIIEDNFVPNMLSSWNKGIIIIIIIWWWATAHVRLALNSCSLSLLAKGKKIFSTNSFELVLRTFKINSFILSQVNKEGGSKSKVNRPLHTGSSTWPNFLCQRLHALQSLCRNCSCYWSIFRRCLYLNTGLPL